MRKSLLMRLSIFALCAMLVFSLACPTFAAGYTGDVDGIFIGEFTLTAEELSANADCYEASFSGAGFKMYKEGLDCTVSFAGEMRVLRWWFYNGDAVEYCFGIGNPHLLDPTLADNGEEFVFTVISKSKPCTFICSTKFYEEHFVNAGSDGLTMTFAVPRFVDSVMDDTGNVFTAAIGMAGTVASTVASYPILFLPIVIGLCGIGVAFFRRIKQ